MKIIKKTIGLSRLGKFIEGTLSGKIDNNYDAEDEYNKKIKKDLDYLESAGIRAEDGIKLRRLFKEIVYSLYFLYSVYSVYFSPSHENEKLNITTGGEDDIDKPPDLE